MTIFLNDILDAENQEQASLKSAPCLSDSVEAIFSKFEQASAFRRLIKEAQSYLSKPHGEKELGTFGSKFAGALYERLAYLLLAAAYTGAGTLLSPARTSKVYCRLHPDMPKRKELFRGEEVDDFPTPDGIVIELSSGLPVARIVYEYTLFPTEDTMLFIKEGYFTKKCSNFFQESARFPQIFGNADLLFIIPKYGYRPQILAGMSRVGFQEMPFKPAEFRIYVDSVIERHSLSPTTRV